MNEIEKMFESDRDLKTLLRSTDRNESVDSHQLMQRVVDKRIRQRQRVRAVGVAALFLVVAGSVVFAVRLDPRGKQGFKGFSGTKKVVPAPDAGVDIADRINRLAELETKSPELQRVVYLTEQARSEQQKQIQLKRKIGNQKMRLLREELSRNLVLELPEISDLEY